jgi:7-cyano-7-deazaguanine synthase
MKMLVVLSGGQDSTTCLFWAKQRLLELTPPGAPRELHAITFDYGQRHIREITAAREVAALAGVTSQEIIPVPNCLKSTSPLTSSTELERYESHAQMEQVIGKRVELTFVPMRNTLFLTIAANRAVALGCRDIVTGVCQEDNANYPDCREFYIFVLQQAFNESLGLKGADELTIHTPLMHLTKAQTCIMASELRNGAWNALAYSHTSYDGHYPPTDMNHANVLRAQGFLEANLPDPLVLRAVREGLMPLPETPNYALENIHVAQGLE